MAFIVGQYPGSERCPRLGCPSRSFLNSPDSGCMAKHGEYSSYPGCLRANNQLIYPQHCSLECHSWFRKSESSLPKPLKPPIIENIFSSLANSTLKLEKVRSDLITAREDRRSYKNISIYVTELPPTPTLWVPRNSQQSTFQKGKKTSPPLPPISKTPDTRAPPRISTPRESSQGDPYYYPPSTDQNQTRGNVSVPAMAIAAYQSQLRSNASAPAMPRAAYQNQSSLTRIAENDVTTTTRTDRGPIIRYAKRYREPGVPRE